MTTVAEAFEVYMTQHHPSWGVTPALCNLWFAAWSARGERDKAVITKAVTDAVPASDSLLEACLDAIANVERP